MSTNLADHVEDPAATITALRKRVAELEGVSRDVATRMHRQVKASDGYAESAAKKDELRPTVWQICNSHFTDLARELEAALRAKGGE